VAGWVRNTDAGDVIVLARGSGDQLDLLRKHLRHGPPGARVTAVEKVADEPPSPPHTPFSIVR
jgi:acylphosphatase